MIPTLSATQRRWLNVCIKAVVIVLLLYVLYKEVYGNADTGAFWQVLQQRWNAGYGFWLLPVLLLMPVNWGLEALKWQALLRPLWRIGFWAALRGVVSGVVFALFTPNRVGDYGGRVLAVPAQHNWKAVLATAAGNWAQLLALLSGGLLGAVYYLQQQGGLPELLLSGFWWLAFGVLALLLLLFFNLSWLANLLKLLPVPQSWVQPILQIRQLHPRLLLGALLLSIARYATYCLQYYLMLRFFGIFPPLWAAMSGIATIFLVQVSVPLPPLAALLARGEAALIIWGPYSEDQLGILAATFGLFIINLCLPALLGAGFIVKINVLKSLGYEKKASSPVQFVPGTDASHGFHYPGKEPPENS